MRTPRTLGRLGRLVRRREVQVVAGLWLLATAAASFFPATGRLGYPSVLFANVLVGLLGPWIGVAAARVEQDLAGAREAAPGLPPGLRAAKGPLRAALLPILVAGGGVAALVALTYATARVPGDQGWSDSARMGTLDYVFLVVLGSLPAAVTLGVLVGAVSRRRRVVGLALPGFLAASVAVSLWPFLTGPQLGIFNHLLGFVPVGGDPVFVASHGLMVFHGLTLAWTGLGVAVLGLTVDHRFRVARPPARGRRLPAAILTGAALVAVGALELRGPTAGFDLSARAAARLGPTVRSAHFVIHLPDDLSRRQMAQVVALHERAYAKVLAYLKLPEGTASPITSWVLDDRRLDLLGIHGVGPAKPWRREINVYVSRRPSGILEEGLLGVGRDVAYVVLGTLGRGPLRVSTAGGLLPNRGLETGLAVAATARWDLPDVLFLAPDRRAEALRATGLARDPRRPFSTLGLFSGTRDDDALDGSFVGWLVATRGIAAVKRAFHAGDLRVLGDPKALFRAWGAALDRAPPTAGERRRLEGVEPVDAEEQLEERGDRRWRAGKPDEAAAAYRLAFTADPCAGRAATKLALVEEGKLANRPRLMRSVTRYGPRAARALLAADPGSAVAEYNLGWHLLHDQPVAPAEALTHLERALAGPLPSFPDLRRRVLADIASARWDTGDDAGAIAAWDQGTAYPAACRRWAHFDRWEADRARFILAWRAQHPQWKPDVPSP